MNINRNNYQRFFLLFADNELSAGEKNMVALFVQQNADLEEEFLMLQQSVVRPDKNITLQNKSFLLKQVQKFISHNNYEEIFALYNDGELKENEEKQTEKFIAEHPELQHEFAVWQKVKLHADQSIVFPDKRSLLKKEVKEKAIPLNLWKALAAAVLLGFGLWAGINFLKDVKIPPLVVNIKPASSGKSAETAIQQSTLPDNNVVKAIDDKPVPLKKILVKNIRVSPVKSPAAHDLVKNMNQNKKDPHGIFNRTAEQNKNRLIGKEAAQSNDIVNKETKKPEQPTTKELIPENKIIANKPVPENYAFTTSYIADEKNDNYIFYNVSEEQFKKSKLGGFLKKVKRVIERKSPFNHNNVSK
jgi:hypothetical protein